MKLAILFHFLGCAILTLAPVVRFHNWSTELKWQQWVGFVVWLICFSLIQRQVNKILPDRDPYLVPLISLFTSWGLLTIFRLAPNFGFRQTLWLAVCSVLFIGFLRVSSLLHILRRYKYVWLTAGLLLTILTFIFGTYPGGIGPNLWLGCCGVFIQPSEVLKTLLIIYLAAYLADGLPAQYKLTRLLAPTLVISGIALLLLIAQRDLGTATLFILLYTIVIYLATGNKKVLFISFGAIIAAFVVGYLTFDVIQLRIEAWLNPWLDPNGRSYQIVQSIIAIANGGIFGRGIGLGSPGVIPVAHSDFIFPAIFEETGLLGAGVLLILYAIFAIRGFSIALHAPNNFQRFLAAGLTTAIASQTILIVGGTIRLLPLTGVTLPYVSYGGTSLLTSFFSGILLLIISNQSEDQPAALGRAKPYLIIGSAILAAIFSLISISVWWSVVRGDDLLTRNDNPRRFISDQYVSRGSIYDRNNQLLVETIGVPGTYSRELKYPQLSAVLGYSDINFGQAGLEASQDSTLRGISENSYGDYLVSRILYSQYPSGSDLRLSLDLNLQQVADKQLYGQTGSIVVLNAETGEILSLSTSPTFDANELKDNMETWKNDPSSPLMNRVTQGLYPPGSATGGFLLSFLLNKGNFPPSDFVINNANTSDCAIQSTSIPTLEESIRDGCQSILASLSSNIQPIEVITLYRNLGLFDQPELQIESSNADVMPAFSDFNALYHGDTNLLVTPLQMALAAASLSNNGYLVQPSLVTSYRKPDSDWLTISNDLERKVIPSIDVKNAASLLHQGTLPGWEISAAVPIKNGELDWFIKGTPDNWRGTPFVVVVALENSSAESAKNVGTSIFSAAISPSE
jgi:cell division protein FtsW (lipid II flippase)